MKNFFFSCIICCLLPLITQAQNILKYSGSDTYSHFGNQYKVAAVAENTNVSGTSGNQVGLLGYGTNSAISNIGIMGSTRANTVGTASYYIAVAGDNDNNSLNVNFTPVYGGYFLATNAGSNSIVNSVYGKATAYSATSTVIGVDAQADNSANITPNRVFGVRGIASSGNSTTGVFLKNVTNPGGYFYSNDGQGVYGTTSGGYNFGAVGKISQGVTGYSNITNAYINTGVVGIAEGTGTFKFGTYGYLDGTAAASTSAAICGQDNIGGATTYAGYFYGKVYAGGNLQVGGTLNVSGTKNFMIDHPLDPENKILRHAAIESNEVLNQYSGNITTDASGLATVTLPDYFETLNNDFRYQLTAIGSFSQVIIKRKVMGNQFIIQSKEPNVEVSWQVTGVRNDKVMQHNPFVAVEEKSSQQKGNYLNPEAYGKPLTEQTTNIPAFGHKNPETPQQEHINLPQKSILGKSN